MTRAHVVHYVRHSYTPVGEFHSQLNLSDTDTAEYTSTYVGESDRNRLGTIPVDTPKK